MLVLLQQLAEVDAVTEVAQQQQQQQQPGVYSSLEEEEIEQLSAYKEVIRLRSRPPLAAFSV